MLGRVRIFDRPIDPKIFFKAFTPPQSFKYLTEEELQRLADLLDEEESQ